MPESDQTIADLERDNHRLQVELQRVRDERDQALRHAARWRRVAELIHTAAQTEE